MKFVIKLLLFMALFVQAQAQNSLRFQKHISPQASHLGDLIIISPDPSHWSAIALASHPKHGERITQQQVLSWLQSRANTQSYAWQGVKTIRVSGSKTKTSGAALIKKAQTALTAALSQHYDHIELKATGIPQDSNLAAAKFTSEFRTGHPPAKRICVRLKQGKHSIPIWFAVEARQKVLVAKQVIKSHQQLKANDFIWQNRNVAGLNTPPLTQLPENAWLKNTLNAQQIITQADLTTAPSAIKGRPVFVTVHKHGVAITVEAIAQADALIGDEVPLLNPKTNKVFTAKITAPNKAEISL